MDSTHQCISRGSNMPSTFENHWYWTAFPNACATYFLHGDYLGCWRQPNIMNRNLVIRSDITNNDRIGSPRPSFPYRGTYLKNGPNYLSENSRNKLRSCNTQGTNTWKAVPYLWVGRHYIIKMSTVPPNDLKIQCKHCQNSNGGVAEVFLKSYNSYGISRNPEEPKESCKRRTKLKTVRCLISKVFTKQH